MKIYAPVKDTNGVRASVRFVNGVGETNDPHLINWFKQHGYKVQVEECNSVIESTDDEITVENDEVGEPDFESMTPIELREWAKANGFGSVIKNTRNKEKLLELIKG